MTRQTFFERHGPFSAADLAERTDAKPGDRALAGRMIADVAPMSDCGPDDVTLVIDRRRAGEAAGLGAGACFITSEFAGHLPARTLALVTPSPESAFARAVAIFYPDAERHGSRAGIAQHATVDATARLEAGVDIEAGAVIGADVEIGAGTLIGANVVICAGVRIGRDCTIGPGASIMHALIGDRVIINAGARIGQDGFGYAQGPDGFVKIPQLGRVIIQNHVEIGANTTIDRGALGDTVVGEGTKIDNLVQIGHNVQVGRSCILVGQSGISGSVRMGDGVLVGGQVGIKPHVEIGSGAELGGRAGVASNVPPGIRVLGSPHRPVDQFLRELRALRNLARKRGEAGSGER